MSKDTINSMQISQTDSTARQNFTSWLPAIMLLAATFFFAACKEGPNTLGKDVLPPGDVIGMKYTDTVTVELETQIIDSVNTYIADEQLFGNYVDPHFGRISATTYLEVLPRSGLNFGEAEDLQFDSIVIRMEISGAYGRTERPQTLRIYELNEKIPEVDPLKRILYSTTELDYNSQKDLANGYSITHNQDGGSVLNIVRLDDELGKKILYASSDTLGDKDLFGQLFKGFAITTDPVTFLSREPGAIFSFPSGDISSYLSLYYKKRNASGVFEDATPEPFLIGTTTPRFHNITRTEVEGKLLAKETATPDDKTFLEFVEGASLVRTFVKFPHLDNLASISVSLAELVIFADTNFMGGQQHYDPPVEMLAVLADENKEEKLDEFGFRLPLDPTNSSTLYNNSVQAYEFDLTGYMQSLISGREPNNGFFLLPRNFSFVANRVVLGGAGHPELKPVLRLTYANLPGN